MAHPLAYYYGYRDCTRSSDLFKSLVDDLAKQIAARQNSGFDEQGKAAGLVIDTFSYHASSQPSYDLLVACAKSMKADIIVVMDMDKLFCDLQRDLGGSDEGGVQIIKLAK